MMSSPRVRQKCQAKKKILNDLWIGECSQVLAAYRASNKGRKRSYLSVQDLDFGPWQDRMMAMLDESSFA